MRSHTERRSTSRSASGSGVVSRLLTAATLPFDHAVDARVADEIEAIAVGHDARVLAVPERPEQPPVPRVERVRELVEGGEVDDAVQHGRRAGDVALRLEAPLDVARGGVERIEAVAVRADVDGPAPDGRRRVDIAARALRPAELPARRAVGVDLAIGRADVDAPVGDGGRGVELAAAPEPVLRPRPPDHLPRARPDRVEVAVVGADEEPVAGLRDRALDPALALERPAHTTGPLVEGVDPPAPVADVDASVGEQRRGLRRPNPGAPTDLPE